jgi:hypothetical protein
MRRIIEVLFTQGCPYIALAIERVRLASHGKEAEIEIRLVRIESFDEAIGRRFLGSPSIRVDDVDVEHWSTSTMYVLHGRGYFVDGSVDRVPATAWIEDALSAAEIAGRKGAPSAALAAAAVPATG